MEASSPQENGCEKAATYQNVVVMRHGHRLDNFDTTWITTSERPWDPPLVEQGLVKALDTGRELRDALPYPIHRVLVSPFLRCVQTASQVVAALSASTDRGVPPSIVKVAIEYGLCEMMNSVAIRNDAAPTDGNFSFQISELERLFPDGTLDHTYQRVYKEMPQWGEKLEGTRTRYLQIFKELADKYPDENLLLVTHGEGVAISVSAFRKDVDQVFDVDYCAYSKLRRPVLHQEQSFTAGEFEEVSSDLLQTGIKAVLRGGTDM